MTRNSFRSDRDALSFPDHLIGGRRFRSIWIPGARLGENDLQFLINTTPRAIRRHAAVRLFRFLALGAVRILGGSCYRAPLSMFENLVDRAP